jgi:hypothetical protein
MEHFSPANDKMWAYRRYLESTFNPQVCHEAVSLMEEDLLAKFYMETDPYKQPKYMDFFRTSDVSKLESAIDARIVILQPAARDEFYKIHDRRIYDSLMGRQEGPTTSFVLDNFRGTGRTRTCDLWLLPEGFKYEQMSTEYIFVSAGTSCVQQDGSLCLLQGLRQVIGLSLEENHQHVEECRSLSSLLKCPERRMFALLPAEFILASHIRSDPCGKSRALRLPERNSFGVLLVQRDPNVAPSSVVQHSSMPVVCITLENRVYRLKPEFAGPVREGQSRQQRSIPGQPYPEPMDAASAKRRKKAANCDPAYFDYKQLYDRDDDERREFLASGHEPDVTNESGSCPCPCKEASSWDKNMFRRGPQQLYKTKENLFDLLKMVGIMTPQNKSRIDRCCDLSIASFDVESYASPVSQAGDEDSDFVRSDVSDQRLPRRVYATHKPALIGLVDQLMMEEGEDPTILEADPNDRRALVASFVETLFQRRDAVVTAKYGILSSLFSWTERYKKAHYGFFVDRGFLPIDYLSKMPTPETVPRPSEMDTDDELDQFEDELCLEVVRKEAREEVMDKAELEAREDAAEEGVSAEKLLKLREAKKQRAIELSWKHSIFGLIESRLHHLAHAYDCFAFNGESFDLVLLCSAVVVYAKESGRGHVCMQREANKVRSITLDGLSLLEAKRLMAPGISLGGLAELCGLEESKAIFPFDKFVSAEYLKEPRLPSDAADWISSLNPDKSPSQSDVDEANRIFDQLGFTSVGAYIRHYLRLDCLILQKAMIVTARGYSELLGLHFVDSGKFTVSSLVTAGSQAFLARNKRIANFFPNHSKIYAVSMHLLLTLAHV